MTMTTVISRMLLCGALATRLAAQQSPAQPTSSAQPAQPTAEEMSTMKFAWKVSKHVKSNAIVFAKDGATLGVGAGQMSRELGRRRGTN